MSKKSQNGASIIVRHEGVYYRVGKVWFDNDGSYYVTVPKYPKKHGYLFKTTADYDTGFNEVKVMPIVDNPGIGKLDDGSVKLSHHFSGFCQFSGPGITSGLDESGQPKGIGVQAASLQEGIDGPAFIIALTKFEGFEVRNGTRSGDVVFDTGELAPEPGANGFAIEGFYRQPDFRRFLVRTSDGWELSFAHPTRLILRTRAILAPEAIDFCGIIGLWMYRLPQPDTVGYSLNGPGGDGRIGEDGHCLADVLMFRCPEFEGAEPDFMIDYIKSKVEAPLEHDSPSLPIKDETE